MNGRLVAQADLTARERGDMFALMQAHFRGVTLARFAADLAEKNWVVLIQDARGYVLGFSTLALYASARAPVRVICSGDTIVSPAARGTTVLARAWLGAVGRWLREDATPLWWLLLSSGFRTYRFLPVYWREFWPRCDAPARPALLDELARERFGERFDEASGIVRLAEPQVLREPFAVAGRLDPHVAFFHRANPGHKFGDELVCLCPLTPDNQSAAGRRLVPL